MCHIELCLCTETLLDTINKPELRQKDVAGVYAMAIVSTEETDWKAVNAAIMARWSMAGLNRVKKMAWKIIDRRGE